MAQQRNSLEQAVIDEEKRSINALALFISMKKHNFFYFNFFEQKKRLNFKTTSIILNLILI